MSGLSRYRGVALLGGLAIAATCIHRLAPRPHVEPAAPIALAAPAPVVRVAPPVAPAPAPPPPAPHRVVIISEDGLRPDVLSAELTPRHMQLMREGATARHAKTILQSDTLPSHASMLSGFGAAAHGLWWNSYQSGRGYIHVPTIFSAAHARGLKSAMIVGKPKLRHIAKPGTVDHFERPSYLCHGVAKRAAAYFTSAKPDLLFVHFSDPDEYGHSHGWMSPEYTRAVHSSDNCLATVLAAIDASDMAETTLVIVTADHGGHGKKHSNGHIAVDRQIPWIVRGPGVGHGVILDETVDTVDTAATTLAALGLPRLPNMLGSSRLTFTR
jgi:predicted AlkP superfamily pyrophosphatase or phosphodiesterase